MASATPSGAPGLGGTGEEWEAFDEEHYDGCSATNAAHHWALGSLTERANATVSGALFRKKVR